MQATTLLLALGALAMTADAAAGQPCTDGAGPRAAVNGYLLAMDEHRFDDAFDYVSASMTDGRTRADWSALQGKVFGPGKVDIYNVDVRDAIATDGDPECRGQALVPNILSSRDRLNSHGLVEFEVYSLINDGHAWRIDSQETLFDDKAIMNWFPDIELIAVDAPE